MHILGRTRRRIEKSVYETGINVALYHFERSKVYKKFTKDLENALLSQIKSVANENTIKRLLMFTKADTPLVTEIDGYVANLGNLLDVFAFLIVSGNVGGQTFLDKFDIDSEFDLKNQALLDFFADHENLLIKNVDDTTKEWIANVIQDGKNRGLLPRDIMQLLIDDGKDISEMRAELIVLTESAWAMSITEMETATRYGIKEIIWRTSIDDRVCPICLPLEGVQVQIGNHFTAGIGNPPAHPRCRCFLEEVIPPEWKLPNKLWLGQ